MQSMFDAAERGDDFTKAAFRSRGSQAKNGRDLKTTSASTDKEGHSIHQLHDIKSGTARHSELRPRRTSMLSWSAELPFELEDTFGFGKPNAQNDQPEHNHRRSLQWSSDSSPDGLRDWQQNSSMPSLMLQANSERTSRWKSRLLNSRNIVDLEKLLLLPTHVLPTSVLPTSVLPTSVLPTSVLPTSVLPTSVLPTSVLPTSVLPTSVLPTSVLPRPVSSRRRNPEAQARREIAKTQRLTLARQGKIASPETHISIAHQTSKEESGLVYAGWSEMESSSSIKDVDWSISTVDALQGNFTPIAEEPQASAPSPISFTVTETVAVKDIDTTVSRVDALQMNLSPIAEGPQASARSPVSSAVTETVAVNDISLTESTVDTPQVNFSPIVEEPQAPAGSPISSAETETETETAAVKDIEITVSTVDALQMNFSPIMEEPQAPAGPPISSVEIETVPIKDIDVDLRHSRRARSRGTVAEFTPLTQYAEGTQPEPESGPEDRTRSTNAEIEPSMQDTTTPSDISVDQDNSSTFLRIVRPRAEELQTTTLLHDLLYQEEETKPIQPGLGRPPAMLGTSTPSDPPLDQDEHKLQLRRQLHASRLEVSLLVAKANLREVIATASDLDTVSDSIETMLSEATSSKMRLHELVFRPAIEHFIFNGDIARAERLQARLAASQNINTFGHLYFHMLRYHAVAGNWRVVRHALENLHFQKYPREKPIFFASVFNDFFRIFASQHSVATTFEFATHAIAYLGLIPTTAVSATFIVHCVRHHQYGMLHKWIETIQTMFPEVAFIDEDIWLEIAEAWSANAADCTHIQQTCNAIIASNGFEIPPYVESMTNAALITALLDEIQGINIRDDRLTGVTQSVDNLINVIRDVLLSNGSKVPEELIHAVAAAQRVRATVRVHPSMGAQFGLPASTHVSSPRAKSPRLKASLEVYPAPLSDAKLPPIFIIQRHIRDYYSRREEQGLPADHSIISYVSQQLLSQSRFPDQLILMGSMYKLHGIAALDPDLAASWLRSAYDVKSDYHVIRALWAILELIKQGSHVKVHVKFLVQVAASDLFTRRSSGLGYEELWFLRARIMASPSAEEMLPILNAAPVTEQSTDENVIMAWTPKSMEVVPTSYSPMVSDAYKLHKKPVDRPTMADMSLYDQTAVRRVDGPTRWSPGVYLWPTPGDLTVPEHTIGVWDAPPAVAAAA